MKWWLVVYMLGKVGGVAGPLPYDGAGCQARADEANAAFAAQIATGVDVKGNPITEAGRSLRMECVLAPVRPAITYKEK